MIRQLRGKRVKSLIEKFHELIFRKMFSVVTFYNGKIIFKMDLISFYYRMKLIKSSIQS